MRLSERDRRRSLSPPERQYRGPNRYRILWSVTEGIQMQSTSQTKLWLTSTVTSVLLLLGRQSSTVIGPRRTTFLRSLPRRSETPSMTFSPFVLVSTVEETKNNKSNSNMQTWEEGTPTTPETRYLFVSLQGCELDLWTFQIF